MLCLLWGMGACNFNEQGYLVASKTGNLAFGNPPRAPFDRAFVEACGAGELSPAGERHLRRRPYVQQVGPDSAEVLWTSSVASRFEVRLTTSDGRQVSKIDAEIDVPSAGASQYIAKFHSLMPGQVYCYSIAVDGVTWLRPTGFRTAPRPGQSVPVTFVAIGDLGARQPDQFAVLQQMMTVEADFAVISGDVAYTSGRLQEFEEHYFDVYQQWIRHVPVFPASGNHDYSCCDAAPFRQVFSLPRNGGERGLERWYSYDWGPVHVVVLDTEKVDSAQLDWLEADLSANTLPWVIAVMHRPPYSAGKHGSDEKMRRHFAPIFERHGVALVITGHDHHYERTLPQNGIVYLVTGGGGRGTRKHGYISETAFAERVAHFVYVMVNGDELTMYAIDASGQVFDSERIYRTR